jgi:lactoylglutathione lyase
MAATAFSFTKIFVADRVAMEAFYTTVLGLKPGFRLVMGEGEDAFVEVQMTVNGGQLEENSLMLVQYLNRAAPAPGEAAIGFTVEVIEETITAAEAAGGRVVAPVQTVSDHGIKAAYIADPEGHIIELLQLSK